MIEWHKSPESTTEELGRVECGKGNYSDYIQPNYAYTRQYMGLAQYQNRIKNYATRNISLGILPIKRAYAHESTISRHRPGTEKWKIPTPEIMDDEQSLRACLDAYLGNSVKNNQLAHFEKRWAVWVDEFLDTKPTPAFLMSGPHRKGHSIEMDDFIPMYMVMRDGDLMWSMCKNYCRYVSSRMTAYLNKKYPHFSLPNNRTPTFWYHCRFKSGDIARRGKGYKYNSKKAPKNADNA